VAGGVIGRPGLWPLWSAVQGRRPLWSVARPGPAPVGARIGRLRPGRGAAVNAPVRGCRPEGVRFRALRVGAGGVVLPGAGLVWSAWVAGGGVGPPPAG